MLPISKAVNNPPQPLEGPQELHPLLLEAPPPHLLALEAHREHPLALVVARQALQWEEVWAYEQGDNGHVQG